MPTALQLSEDGSEPVLQLDSPAGTILDIPLGGYPTVDDLMDRFPEEVYDRSRDSHLYRFMQGLCGDAGAGILKKQSYAARLKYEANGFVFGEIDAAYRWLRFPRLSFEMPPGDFDPTSSILTKAEWDAIEAGDASYKHRIAKFMEATRLGNSPEGIADAAEAGSGVRCDIVETYKSVFSERTDDVDPAYGGFTIPYQGKIKGTGEFVVIPHLEDADAYTSRLRRTTGTYPVWTASTAYIVGDIVTPSSAPGDGLTHFYAVTVAGTSGASAPTWVTDGSTFTNGTVTFQDVGDSPVIDNPGVVVNPGDRRLDPERERNMVHVLDQVRPVGTLPTVTTRTPTYLPIKDADGSDLQFRVSSNSMNFRLVRYVTGRLDVDWPTPDEKQGATENNPDRRKGYFIEASVEKEQKMLPFSQREKPVIHHTIENVYGYKDDILDDTRYNTTNFVPSYNQFISFHTGRFNKIEEGIFPALNNLPIDNEYRPWKSVAVQESPLIFEQSPKNG